MDSNGALDEDQATLVKQFIEECPSEEIASAKFRVESIESVALRFLRARQFDLSKAKTLLHEAFLKKIEHDVSQKIKLTAEENAKCNINAAKNWYPHSMPGFDKLNRPILFEHTGGITPSVLSVMTTKEDLVCYHWWVMENLLNQAFEEAANRSQQLGLPFAITTFVVLDFAGLNSSHCTKAMLDHVKGLVAIDNCCYPEILGKLVVVNAPWLSVGLWNLVKGWLDPRTQAKIEILNTTDSATKLLEYIDADLVPACYGGQGPPYHVPKPDTESVFVPRNGHIRRTVVVPRGQELIVDTYISEGIVEFVVAVVDTMEPQHHHGMTASSVAGSNHHTHGTNLIRTTITGTGTPARFLYKVPLSDQEMIAVISWNNSSRFSTRHVVYSIDVRNPAEIDSINESDS